MADFACEAKQNAEFAAIMIGYTVVGCLPCPIERTIGYITIPNDFIALLVVFGEKQNVTVINGFF
jgi:hypothetical protein